MDENTKRIRLFHVAEGGVHVLYSDDMLKEQGVTEEELVAALPEGTWEHIEVRSPYLKKHAMAVEAALQEVEDGQFKVNWGRYEGALVQTVVTDWSFKWPMTEAGFGNMPTSLADAVFAIVSTECRRGGVGNPSFLQQRINKWRQSSEDATKGQSTQE